MHLGNGIICPVTGIPMLIIAGTAMFFAFKNAKKDFTEEKIFPAIITTALVFALQMINFSIPMTGSSGHIVGAILLSAILGPYAGFLAMCSILFVQAVFFADGGLLALGCNIFNMGILACFAAYPLIYKPFAAKNKPVLGLIFASIAALQLGAFAAVIESALSNSVSWHNILNFAGLMQAIHLPIGIVEGIVTGAIFAALKSINPKKIYSILGVASLVLAGFISPYASQKPDGLEWSLLNVSDSVVLQTQNILYAISEALQSKTAVLTSLPAVLGNISGLLAAAALMFLICKMLNRKITNN